MSTEVEIMFTTEVTFSLTVSLSKVARATGSTVRELRQALEDGDFDPFSDYLSNHSDREDWEQSDDGDPQVDDVQEA